MISQRLINAINDQINYEFFSAHIYLSFAAYCSSKDMDGFANFFIVQAEEEKFHAMKFFNYLNDVDAKVKLTGIPDLPEDPTSSLDVFVKALEHEETVTKRIYNLTDLATEEREHATISLLKWFIDEQIEEMKTVKNLIKKIERIGDDRAALYMLDAELAARVFTPPTTA